jgi:hypothetical protein
MELEATLAELKALHLPDGYAAKLRAARRPKPPSLKEQRLIGIQPTPTSTIVTKDNAKAVFTKVAQ